MTIASQPSNSDRSDEANTFLGNPLLHLPKSSVEGATLEGAALSMGLTVQRFNGSIFVAWDRQGNRIGFRRSWSTLSSVVGSEICVNKAASKSLMKFHGIPTAVGGKMPRRGTRSARDFVKQEGFPVVVKPLRGSGGQGVTADIVNFDQLREAIQEADSRDGFLIEKHVPGKDYRFLVLGDEVAGVWVRDAANVIGDGSSSVSTLIDAKNEVRSRNPHLFTRPIKKDQLVKNHLARDDRNLEYVAGVGEKVYLRSAANLSSGGDNIEVTDAVHQSLKDIAVRAKQSVPGIELVGVDVLMENHLISAEDQHVNICEINGQPGLSAHDYPMYGPPRDVAREYVEFIAEKCGLELSNVGREVGVEIIMDGVFREEGIIGSIQENCEMLNLDIEINEVHNTRIEMSTFGDPLAIAVLANLSVSSAPRDGQVESLLVSPS